MNVLLVRLSALGDLVHALPAYSALRAAFPGERIGWLVEDRHAALLEMLPGIAYLHRVPRRKWKKAGFSWREAAGLRRELRAGDYQAAVDLQGLTKSALWPWLARIRVRVGFGDRDGRELSRAFYNRRVCPEAARRHVVDRNLALAEALGARPAPPLALQVPPEVAAAVDAWWERYVPAGRRVALLNPGAGWESKRWPPAHFGALARFLTEDLGLLPIALWGPGEENLAGEVVETSGGLARALPPTSIPEMVEVVSRAALFVGGDTGPTHLAAYLGVPCLAPYGASDPVRNGPWGAPSLLLTRDLACRPCWKEICPLTHLECLRGLAPGAEFARIAAWWAGLPSRRRPG